MGLAGGPDPHRALLRRPPAAHCRHTRSPWAFAHRLLLIAYFNGWKHSTMHGSSEYEDVKGLLSDRVMRDVLLGGLES